MDGTITIGISRSGQGESFAFANRSNRIKFANRSKIADNEVDNFSLITATILTLAVNCQCSITSGKSSDLYIGTSMGVGNVGGSRNSYNVGFISVNCKGVGSTNTESIICNGTCYNQLSSVIHMQNSRWRMSITTYCCHNVGEGLTTIRLLYRSGGRIKCNTIKQPTFSMNIAISSKGRRSERDCRKITSIYISNGTEVISRVGTDEGLRNSLHAATANAFALELNRSCTNSRRSNSNGSTSLNVSSISRSDSHNVGRQSIDGEVISSTANTQCINIASDNHSSRIVHNDSNRVRRNVATIVGDHDRNLQTIISSCEFRSARNENFVTQLVNCISSISLKSSACVSNRDIRSCNHVTSTECGSSKCYTRSLNFDDSNLNRISVCSTTVVGSCKVNILLIIRSLSCSNDRSTCKVCSSRNEPSGIVNT